MSNKSTIEWTDATWNPVTGCAKVSAGCKHCYAEREWPRLTRLVPAYAGRKFTDVRTHEDRLDQPIRWKRPRQIFVNSMSDLFHPDVPNDFLPEVFAVAAVAKWHIFQALTKRAERMRDVLNDPVFFDAVACIAKQVYGVELSADDWPLANVWLGVSVEDQAAADERIPLLLDTPAAVRWISAEPLLGAVDLTRVMRTQKHSDWTYCDNALTGMHGTQCGQYQGNKIDWVVVGGESGPKARPMHPAWARSLRDQCAAAGVPFLFKQWGEWVPRSSCYHTFDDGKSCADIDPTTTKWPCIRLNENGGDGHRLEDEDGGDSAYMQRTGKKIAGRLLDGITHDGYPEGDIA